MAEKGPQPSRFPDRIGLSMMAIASGILAGLIVLTQLQYILLAIVLAYVLAPVQQRLERYLSSTMAAITLIVISIFVVLVPVAYLLTIAIQQGLGLLRVIQDGELSLDIIDDRIKTIGYVIDLDLLYATYQEQLQRDCNVSLPAHEPSSVAFLDC